MVEIGPIENNHGLQIYNSQSESIKLFIMAKVINEILDEMGVKRLYYTNEEQKQNKKRKNYVRKRRRYARKRRLCKLNKN